MEIVGEPRYQDHSTLSHSHLNRKKPFLSKSRKGFTAENAVAPETMAGHHQIVLLPQRNNILKEQLTTCDLPADTESYWCGMVPVKLRDQYNRDVIFLQYFQSLR